jgi:hypothetical protein
VRRVAAARGARHDKPVSIPHNPHKSSESIEGKGTDSTGVGAAVCRRVLCFVFSVRASAVCACGRICVRACVLYVHMMQDVRCDRDRAMCDVAVLCVVMCVVREEKGEDTG